MPVVSVPKGNTELRVLGEFLNNNFNADELKKLHRELTDEPALSKKGDLTQALSEFLLGPHLKEVFERLDKTDMLAVAEALHSPDGYVPEKFEAMHGARANFGERSSYRANPKLLRLFMRYQESSGSYKVPLSLKERLRAFVPKPDLPVLEAAEAIPSIYERTSATRSLQEDDPGRVVSYRKTHYVMPTKEPKINKVVERFDIQVADRSETAQSELFAVLRMIQQGKIAVSEKTHVPNSDMMWKISRVLDGDYFQDLEQEKFADIGYIRAFAWIKLVQEAGLARVTGKKLSLSMKGTEALSKKPVEILQSIWTDWLDCYFDEFTRIDSIKGQSGKAKRSMSNPVERRAQIVKTLRDCPTGKWVLFENFSKYMRACGNSFEVTYDPWALYMDDPNYGSLGYSDRCVWEVLQDRYLMCFLFEYAATLGLIDIAFVEPEIGCRNFKTFWGFDDHPYLSRYDGLFYFRVNELGAYCLGTSDKYAPSKKNKTLKLSVMSNLRVKLLAGKLSPHESLLLESFAESIGDDVWEISQSKCLEACESGMKISDLREFLSTCDDQPLPETVDALLAKVEKNADALLPLYTATVFFCVDKEIAKKIAAHNLTKKLCQITHLDMLVVRTSDVEKFRKAIKVLGFGAGVTS